MSFVRRIHTLVQHATRNATRTAIVHPSLTDVPTKLTSREAISAQQHHQHSHHHHHRHVEPKIDSFTYGQLLADSASLAKQLLQGRPDLKEERIAFLSPPTYDYVVMMWAIWRAGGIAVPLCVSHPATELKYYIEDSSASSLLAHPSYSAVLQSAVSGQIPLIQSNPSEHATSPSTIKDGLPTVDVGRRAMIIYTSGTTGAPKGVVSTHAMIEAQVNALVHAWEWRSTDTIYNPLPLHHVHGIINVLTCGLWSGARVEMPAKFDVAETWNRFERGDLSLFMAVPTIYSKLIAAFDSYSPTRQQQLSQSLSKLRLMVSGSAALPDPIMHRWKDISGHTLLERYGMSEMGMALSNPLHGHRLPGYVGLPLHGVTVKLFDSSSVINPHLFATEPVIGELGVVGANVFSEYWGRPEATAKEFDSEGFFKTGDIVEYNPKVKSYKILGRASSDIIKTGGEKVSALDIERELLAHSNIAECAVVGVPHSEWGQLISAVIVVKDNKKPISLEEVRSYLGDRLASYKIPKQIKIVRDIPRNAMGKVNKKELVKLLF